ncbi:hypothetical protein [Porphyrobacter sp. AAP60]|uniref:hypothetical protein n=1 Tax=Porphyrobacter sp. AAP60 TaxID=1523423 RepID=UPI0006B9D241|nr:hypothetical protein [Porphyrobacter sp. AAP60]KPF63373.1 hypothetical protein IP79_09485 [Porphyrobacter sp. AAP60]
MIDTPSEPPAVQEHIIEQKLLECGLKAGGFSVKYEDYLQSIEIIITPEAGATPEHFGCIHEAAFPEVVSFADAEMYRRYMAYVDALFRPQMLADAEAELKKRGLWDNFPARDGYPTLADYARALEAHAGFAPGTMLRAEDSERVAFDPYDNQQFAAIDFERVGALLAVLVFASARNGFSMGFIGNDKVRE